MNSRRSHRVRIFQGAGRYEDYLLIRTNKIEGVDELIPQLSRRPIDLRRFNNQRSDVVMEDTTGEMNDLRKGTSDFNEMKECTEKFKRLMKSIERKVQRLESLLIKEDYTGC